MRKLLTVILMFLPLYLFGQTRGALPRKAKLAFYNVENLYDTIPSLFYDDSDYTPRGSRRWDAERYGRKLANLGRVIDQMDADMLGMCEVESEQAVRDLVTSLGTDYNYIHHTGSDRRGMDLALLYKGDRFVPDGERLVRSRSGREFLYVRGELLGQRVDVVVCHMPSQLNTREARERALTALRSFADSLHRSDPEARVVVMGDFNATPADRSMRRIFGTGRKYASGGELFLTPFSPLAAKGYGTYAFRNRWQLLDNIFLSNRLSGDSRVRYADCGIFSRGYMLGADHKNRQRYPLRTFSGGQYLGGFSDHLPVYVILEIR